MKKFHFSNFGFSTVLLTFSMICIVTFSALAFMTARSDYQLSRRVADNNTRYYDACEQVYDEISQIDAILKAAYQNSPDRNSFFSAVNSILTSADGQFENKETSIIYTIKKPVSDNQYLCVKLGIRYPTHDQDTFFKINEWKLETNTSFEENDTLNLIGGN